MCKIILDTNSIDWYSLIMKNDLNVAAGQAVATARGRVGMSQLELAKLLNKTRTSVSNIERGKQAMSLAMFCKISNLLHVAPYALLEEVVESHVTLSGKNLPKSVEKMFVRGRNGHN
jgi:transcriptional regulator with XRE-family HTH domain